MTKLIVTIELEDGGLAEDATLYDCDELINLLYGISNGNLAGRVERIESPTVAIVVDAPVEKHLSNPQTVGDLRAFLADVPDYAKFNSYSGSVESLVNFGLSYDPSPTGYDSEGDSPTLTVQNEN